MSFHLYGHPIEIHDAPHLLRHLRGSHALVLPVHVEVKVAAALPEIIRVKKCSFVIVTLNRGIRCLT